MPAPDEPSDPLYDRLAAFIGQPLGAGGPSVAPDPVNAPMIRHWAAAIEDANPIYTDPAAGRAAGFDDVVAPPLMLQTWTMATPTITGIAERGGAPTAADPAGVLAALDDAGFTGTLASNSEFEIDRYLDLGEVVTASTAVEAISSRKQTRLGPGYFVTWVTSYGVGTDVVGRQRFRILKFQPAGAAA